MCVEWLLEENVRTMLEDKQNHNFIRSAFITWEKKPNKIRDRHIFWPSKSQQWEKTCLHGIFIWYEYELWGWYLGGAGPSEFSWQEENLNSSINLHFASAIPCSTWGRFLHLVPLYLTSFPHFFSVSNSTSMSLSDSIQTSFLGRSISNFTSPSLLRTLATAPEHPSQVIATSNSCLVMFEVMCGNLLPDRLWTSTAD